LVISSSVITLSFIPMNTFFVIVSLLTAESFLDTKTLKDMVSPIIKDPSFRKKAILVISSSVITLSFIPMNTFFVIVSPLTAESDDV